MFIHINSHLSNSCTYLQKNKKWIPKGVWMSSTFFLQKLLNMNLRQFQMDCMNKTPDFLQDYASLGLIKTPIYKCQSFSRSKRKQKIKRQHLNCHFSIYISPKRWNDREPAVYMRAIITGAYGSATCTPVTMLQHISDMRYLERWRL